MIGGWTGVKARRDARHPRMHEGKSPEKSSHAWVRITGLRARRIRRALDWWLSPLKKKNEKKKNKKPGEITYVVNVQLEEL